MNDDEFDDLLRDAASTYNTPPTAPREAMWDAITAARSSVSVVPIPSARPAARWLAGSIAAAAVLLLGIAIGRQSRTGDVPAKLVASTERGAPRIAQPVDAPHAAAAAAPSSASISDVPSAVVPRSRDLEEARPSRGRASRLATLGARSRAGAQNSADTDGFNEADAYRLAVIEHLTRTEVLLTDFRAEARSGGAAKLDAQFAAVSRELLGTTRLFLATRRGEDQVMTRLLQDLEYVLMQLSQYANDGRGVDLDAINQSIDRRNVLPKLRYSIPAGVSASAGT